MGQGQCREPSSPTGRVGTVPGLVPSPPSPVLAVGGFTSAIVQRGKSLGHELRQWHPQGQGHPLLLMVGSRPNLCGSSVAPGKGAAWHGAVPLGPWAPLWTGHPPFAVHSRTCSAAPLHRDWGLQMGVLCPWPHPRARGHQSPPKPPGSVPWLKALPLIRISLGLPDSGVWGNGDGSFAISLWIVNPECDPSRLDWGRELGIASPAHCTTVSVTWQC